MVPAEDIQTSLAGALRLMRGKADGLRLLDVSADGFWNSFFAIVIALPPSVLGWIALADDLVSSGGIGGSRISVLLRLAMVDLSAWILPLVMLGLVAGTVGIGARYVHYVVATNWSAALIAWLMLPPSLVRLFSPQSGDVADSLALGLFLFSLFLWWRVTNIAIGKGPAAATAVLVGMLVASLGVVFWVQDLLGLVPADQIAG